jgi:Uncharacterized MobA-related protein
MSNSQKRIAALVLAAGLSKRMGMQKLLLPWRESTIIEAVIQTVFDAGIYAIYVVTGSCHAQVSDLLKAKPVSIVYNSNYETGEMISSIKCGLSSLSQIEADAVMVFLGDQPQIEKNIILALLEKYEKDKPFIIIPSYHNRRGHPILIPRDKWQEIIGLPTGATLKDWINDNKEHLSYLVWDNPGMLEDIDTPEDYQKFTSSLLKDEKSETDGRYMEI